MIIASSFMPPDENLPVRFSVKIKRYECKTSLGICRGFAVWISFFRTRGALTFVKETKDD